MAGIRTTSLQSSFSFGEFSPWLVARTTFDKYPGALETCENAIPLIEGGYARRPGSRYVTEVKDSSKSTRLKRFQFSVQQSHILEMGDGYFRFYRYQGQLTVADTDAAISNGDFTSNITGWDDLSTGAAAISHDATNGMLNLDGVAGESAIAEQDVAIGASFQSTVHVLKFRVARAGNAVAGDEIELQVGTASGTADLVDGKIRGVGYHCVPITLDADATIYIQFINTAAKTVKIDDVSLIDNAAVEIGSPYAEADLFNVEGPQSADVLYLFHESYAPHKLERYANNEWSLTEVNWKDGPYLTLNATDTTMTPAATTGLGITVTASAVTGINSDAGFQSTDVGRLISIDNPASNVDWGYARITGVTNTTTVTVDIIEDFATTNADVRWRLGAWSDTTGWPKAATFAEQRLWAAGTNDNPQTIWLSKTADFEVFSPNETDGTVVDDNGRDWTLSSGDVNPILWMAEQRSVIIGTNGGEWVATSDGPIITPTDMTVRRQSSIGSARIDPQIAEGRILFTQRADRRIYEYGYNFDDDAHIGLDKTRLARHITRGGIVELAYAQQPHSLLLCPRDDGQLLSMTYNRREQIEGWSRHIFGGTFEVAFSRVWRVNQSTGSFLDETTDANSDTDGDWAPFPPIETVGDWAAMGYTAPFDRISFDYANGTAGTEGVVEWEYWASGEWKSLPDLTDATVGFTATAADNLDVTWTLPTDWTPRSIGGSSPLYYVRARITTKYKLNPALSQGFIYGNAVCESVETIPGQDDSGQTQDSTDRDEIWVIVKRTINNQTKRYIEFLEGDFETGDDQEDAYYVDSMLTYDGAATTSLSGLDHLEAESVGVWGDGAIIPDETVSSGAITADSSLTVAQIGLRYKHKLKLLKLDFGATAGTSIGARKRVDALTFVLYESHTVKYGPDADSLQTDEFRVVSDPMDAGAPLFTGEHRVDFAGDWGDCPCVVIESDDPCPFTLLALTPVMHTSELA